MSRSRIFSKLIIPIALLTIYSFTLYKTATTPVGPTSSEEQEAQSTTNIQSPVLVESNSSIIPHPPQAPSAFIGAENTLEKFRFVVLTDPKMVPASQATWLEPDEVVLGIVHDGEARAYPLNQMALHHIINASVAEASYVITYCALCNGHAMAFNATIENIRYTYDIYGIYENSLALIDRQTASIWHQLDGNVLSGPLAAQGLSLQPAVLTRGTWEDWKGLYPETLVLPQYPDYVDQYQQINLKYSTPESQLTALRNRDTRLPPNSLVLGTNIGNFYRAYLLNDTYLFDGVINDNLDGSPVVIFFDETKGFGNVFRAMIMDQILSFSQTNGRFVDSTGSFWDVSGRAVEGALKGNQLIPVASLLTEWSTWSMYHPETSIYGR